jgi:acylphosphatase
VARELVVRDSRGYAFAEVTAGVPSRGGPSHHGVAGLSGCSPVGEISTSTAGWAGSTSSGRGHRVGRVARASQRAGSELLSCAPPSTFRYRITGRVQGVGYRYSPDGGPALGVAGYAKNLPDGSVEVVAEGSPEAVQAFEERLREGPRSPGGDRGPGPSRRPGRPGLSIR